jgi:hypothetical protein
MHISESDLPKEFIKKNSQMQMNCNPYTNEKQKHSFLSLGASCLETNMAIIPKINPNLLRT